MARADWFLDSPPATGASALRVQDVGTPFDLRDRGSLERAAAQSIQAEARLFDAGITCPIRDQEDTCCMACAVSHHAEPGHRLQPLCRLGREQERLITALAWQRRQPRGA